MTNATAIWHIRKAGEMRADRRFTVRSGRNGTNCRQNVNRHGTLCGAEPTENDKDRDGAAHLIKNAQIPQLKHWADGMCETCRSKL